MKLYRCTTLSRSDPDEWTEVDHGNEPFAVLGALLDDPLTQYVSVHFPLTTTHYRIERT